MTRILAVDDDPINAIEHGNLGLSYADKTHLMKRWQLLAEIDARLQTPPWSERRATIAVRRLGGEIEFTIADQGAGFAWETYLNYDPRRAFDVHGRGIALANTLSFSSLVYQAPGNVVMARADSA